MAVDRALDAWVAQHVMGLTVTWLRDAGQQRRPWLLHHATVSRVVQPTTQGWQRGVTDTDEQLFWLGGRPVPYYSSDLLAGWEVKDRFMRGSQESAFLGAVFGAEHEWRLLRHSPDVVAYIFCQAAKRVVGGSDA